MDNIIFVTGLHGNEPIPVIALTSKKIDQLIGNPPALVLNKRFIDMDMNKAFGLKGTSNEEKLARNLLRKIDKRDYVIDLHTCSAKTEPFAIITDLKMFPLARTLGLKYVVHMKHNIKNGHALIDYRNGISVETGMHNTQEAFTNTIKVAKNVLLRKVYQVTLLEVFGIITKPGKYVNFQTHKDGYIPVLAGEKAYDFVGLKARFIDQ